MDAQHQKTNQLKLHHYNIWQLIKVYWQSSERKTAYLFAAVILIMTVAMVVMDVVLNYWYNNFYNALQKYDSMGVLKLMGVFCVIAFVLIVLAVYRYYLSQLFSLRWRKWLTEQFVERWLDNRGYYYLEQFEQKTDNPDQRIQEDIGALVSNTLDLTVGLITSIGTLCAFIFILWSLSGNMHIDLGSYGEINFPGYLVWVALLYSLAGTVFAFKIGHPLILLNFEQQRREASFRFAAVNLRTHAEHIALYGGEHQQQTILHRLFGHVLDNWYLIILRQKLLIWFTAGFNQVSVLLPLLVALPNYFEKIFLLGGLIQCVQAFGKVQDSLSYLIASYSQIALWRATGLRLTTFINHLNDVEEEAATADHLVFNKNPVNKIITKQVDIDRPHHEQPLLRNVNTELLHGRHYVIKGDSGIGKSTFVRTLAGIWPYAAGEISVPENKNIMFLPQKPYMPLGTLAEALVFPDKDHLKYQDKLEQVLIDCNLENLIPRLYETASWTEQLSPGEQQRIAFARVLLHRPDWVFFDESTSMLDVANEKTLYTLLKEKLPGCTIVSVGHRPSLDAYHDEVIDMTQFKAQPA